MVARKETNTSIKGGQQVLVFNVPIYQHKCLFTDHSMPLMMSLLLQVHGPLGNDLMSYNLQGPVREGDAVRVCALLEAGGVTIGTFNKGCRPVMHAATMMQKE